MARVKATTIDGYLAGVSGPRRAALERLRKTIRSIVPKAEECISYGIPAFRLDGKVVAGLCATSDGCSYFPFSGTTLKTLAADVAAYDQTKSALHFDPAKPLPASLVRKLIAARIAETHGTKPQRVGRGASRGDPHRAGAAAGCSFRATPPGSGCAIAAMSPRWGHS